MRRKFTQTLSGRNIRITPTDKRHNYFMLLKLYEMDAVKKNIAMPVLPARDPRNKIAINYRSTYQKPKISFNNLLAVLSFRKYLPG